MSLDARAVGNAARPAAVSSERSGGASSRLRERGTAATSLTTAIFAMAASAWGLGPACGKYESCDESLCGACIYGSFEVRFSPEPAGSAVATIEGLTGSCSRTAEPGLQVCRISGGRLAPGTVRVTVRLAGHEPGTLDVTFGAPMSFVCCSCPVVTVAASVTLVPRAPPDGGAVAD